MGAFDDPLRGMGPLSPAEQAAFDTKIKAIRARTASESEVEVEAEAEAPTETDALKSEMTRKRVREMGAQEAYKQPKYLSAFGEGLNLDTFLGELGKKPELWKDENVQKLAEIELKKRFGYIQPKEKAPQLYSMLVASEKAKESLDLVRDKLTPKDLQVWGAEYTDVEGNPQYLELSRIKTEKETEAAKHRRFTKGIEKVGTPEGVLETINVIPADLQKALANSKLEWQLLQELSDKVGRGLTFEEAIARTDTSEGRRLAQIAEHKRKRGARFSLPLTRSLQGDTAIDVNDSIRRLSLSYESEEMARSKRTFKSLSTEEYADLNYRSIEHAKKRMREITALNTGTLWVDVDPDGTTQNIINNPAWAGGRVTAPIRAMWAGLQTQDQYFGRAPETLGKEGGLEWFGRQALSTMVGAALHAGEWGSDEHIKLIREGYDITDDFGIIAKFITPKFLEREQLGNRGPEVAIGLVSMFGLILLDPDILTIPIFAATKPVKALWRSGRIPLTRLNRLQKTQKLAREQSLLPDEALFKPKLEDPTELDASIATHINELRHQDQALGDYAAASLGARLGVEPVQEIHLVGLQRGKEAALKKIEELEGKIKLSGDADRVRWLKEEKFRTEVKLAETELEAADIALDVAEATMKLETDLLNVKPGFVLKDKAGKVLTFSLFAQRRNGLKKGNPAAQARAEKWWDAQDEAFIEVVRKSNLNDLKLPTVRHALRTSHKEGGLKGLRASKRAARVEEIKGKLVKDGMPKAQADRLTDVLMLPKPDRTSTLLKQLDGLELRRQNLIWFDKHAGFMIAQSRLQKMRVQQARLSLRLNSKAGVKPGKFTPKGKPAKTRAGLAERLQKMQDKHGTQALTAAAAKAGRKVAIAEEQRRIINVEELYRETMGEVADLLDLIIKHARTGKTPLQGVQSRITAGADILAKATKKELAEFERIVDPNILVKSIDDAFDKTVMDPFKVQGGEEAARFGRVMAKLKAEKATSDRVVLTGKEVADFQAGVEALERLAPMIGGKFASHRQAEVLLNAMHSPYLPVRFKLTELGKWQYAADLSRVPRKIFTKLSPASQRLGDLGYDMTEILKRSIQVRAKFEDEIHDLIRLSPNDSPIRVLSTYLMSTNPMKLRNGWTSVNTGSASIYRKGVEQIVEDSRIIEEKGGKVILKADKLAEDVGDTKALDAIARAWLPQEKFPPGRMIELRKIAYNIIKKQYDDDALDFNALMIEMKNATKNAGAHSKKDGYTFNLNWGGAGSVDEATKAYSFGALGIGHAMVLNDAARTATKMVGGLTTQAAADASDLITGGGAAIAKSARAEGKKLEFHHEELLVTPGGAGVVGDTTDARIEKGLDALARYGISIIDPTLVTQQKRKVIDLVRISKNPDGINAFLPTTLISEIDKAAGKIVKETWKYNAGARDDLGIGSTLNGFWRLYRTSLVSGLLVPNPRYWVNNIFGDFAQIWWGHGLKTATTLSFQNFAMNMPWGRQLHNKQLQMQAKLGSEHVLAPITNAIFNPDLDKVWRAADDQLIQLGNQLMEVGTLRKQLDADGVMDTFVHATLREAAEKASKESLLAFPTKLRNKLLKENVMGEMYSSHATFVQQRQRAAFYLEMRRKGMNRKEATEALRRTLYDWKDPLTAVEMKVFAQVSTFYRFYRLMMKQTASMLLEPFTTPISAKSIVAGNTSLGKLRQMVQGTNIISDATYWGSEQQQRNTLEDNALAKGLREVGPWWNHTRPPLNSYPMDPMYREYWAKKGKAGVTHETTLMPAFTPFDGAQLGMTTMAGLVGVSAHLAGVPMTDDWMKQSYDPLMNMLLPPVSQTFGGYLDSLTGDSFWGSGALSTLRPGEAEILSMMSPLAGHPDWMTPQQETPYSKVKAPAMVVDLFRMLPFIGTQLPTFWAAADNPAWAKSNAEGIWYAMRGLTSFKPYPINPLQEMEWGYERRKRATTKELSAAGRQAGWELIQKTKRQEDE